MKCVALGCLVYLTIGVGLTSAGFQVKKHIGALRCEGLQLKSQDAQLGLAKTGSGIWFVSAPTITDAKGLFLCGDPEGKSPTVHLARERGSYGSWAFEFSEKWQSEKAGPQEGKSNANFLVGKSGFRFKMKLADGPFKNWYIGLDPLPEEAQGDPKIVSAWRPLKLVQDSKSAAVFDYHEEQYEVGHK
jgi:hypothetical protein